MEDVMQKLFAALLAASLMSGLAISADAAGKKDVRSTLTREQKAQIRAKAKAYCAKKYTRGSIADVIRVEILSDGRVRCWYRS